MKTEERPHEIVLKNELQHFSYNSNGILNLFLLDIRIYLANHRSSGRCPD